MFAVRIVCMDYSMSPPVRGLDPQNSNFRGSSIAKLPIIRIFGTTDEGEKACLHIHGAFPYIYIPFEGIEDPKVVAYQVALGLDKALNISQGQASSNHQHVYEVTVESAIPFYGYHVHKQTFLKIIFYSPSSAKRSCTLLQNGAVLGRQFQPHEAHIPFHQQFMIDYNLHGMNVIKLRKALHRDDPSNPAKRVSLCILELDASVEDILNVSEIGDVNPGIAYICEEEKLRRGSEAEVSKFLTLERTMTPEASLSSEKFKILLKSKLEEVSDSDVTQSQESFLDISCVNDDDADFLLSMANDNNEEDSILSQRPKDDEADDEPELQVPLASVTTPVKDVVGDETAEDDDFWNDSFFITPENEPDIKKVEQVDGNNDSSSDEFEVDEIKTNILHSHKANVFKKDTSLANSSLEEYSRHNLSSAQLKLQTMRQSGGVSDSVYDDFSLNNSSLSIDQNRDSNESLVDNFRIIRQVDGADNSSTSSEDDETVKKKKTRKVRQSSSQFPALQVTVRSPSKNKAKSDYSFSQSQFISHSNSVKRKLGFERLDSTLVEENISCRYSPAKSDRSKSDVMKMESQEIIKDTKTLNEHAEKPSSCSDIFEKPIIETKSIPTNTDVDTDSKDSSDIFTPETLQEIKLQEESATKYDTEIDYIAVPGPSKDARIVLSGSTSSSSSLPTPHQQEQKESQISDNKLISQPVDDSTFEQHEFSSISVLDCVEKKTSQQSNDILMQKIILEDKNITLNKNERTLSAHNLTINERIEANFVSASEKTTDGFCVFVPKYNPPSRDLITSTMTEYGVPEARNQDPFYSNPSDVNSSSMEVGQAVLKVKSKTAADYPDFDSNYKGIGKLRLKSDLQRIELDGNLVNVATAKRPPSRREVELWVKARSIRKQKEEIGLKNKQAEETKKVKYEFEDGGESDVSLNVSQSFTPLSDILDDSVCTLTNQTIEEAVENKDISTMISTQNKTTSYNDASLQRVLDESHLFRESCSADGSHQITGIQGDGFKFSLENYQNVKTKPLQQHLIVMSMEIHVSTRGAKLPDPDLDAVAAIFYAIDGDKQDSGFLVNENENELFADFLELVRKWDPDILIGYEIEMGSWGYLVERGFKLGLNYVAELGRIPIETSKFQDNEEAVSNLSIVGRVVLDLWRLLRHELALTSYTFESCVYHVLHERIPLFSHQVLTNWWTHKSEKMHMRTIDFYMFKVKTVLRLVDHFDLIGRTSELARLFGILFYEVFSRGSQFRVESMMLRLAKPNNYIPVSPSVQQRAKMRAPEYLPLILEPESKFYKDPVIVLDFQSLYPSMIIAYNYCFTTCVGRVENLGTNNIFEFGATNLKISRNRLRQLLSQNLLHFAPCGVGFVKPEVRDGILPRMLREILDTRLLVKDAMKQTKSNKTLQRVLHSRQLGLKLIANVTYGYTAANFSGRMPAVEIADSVVSKGRETLLRAIRLVENHPNWNAKVVYGDTDSLFVLTPGRTRKEAFRIGAEIANQVTNENPSPVRLKLEKVYQPCILQTKKRYVGYLYESPDQETPDFDAKGIETVRRDGIPAVAKMLEKCLRMLFETRDVSAIKKYVQRQFHKLLSGRLSIQDLTFAKEYRGESGYRPGACVPALELAKKWKAIDRRKEPRRSERVPYIIVNGPPGLPLIRLIRSPSDVLNDSSLKPNAIYYITKAIIPPLNRCFLLIGVDINDWFNEMPRRRMQYLPTSSPTKGKKSTISQYFATTNCACCTKQTKDGLCSDCVAKSQYSAIILHEKLMNWERNYYDTYKMCQSCCGRISEIPCISLDCPVLYRLVQTNRDLQQADYVRDLINNRLPNTQ